MANQRYAYIPENRWAYLGPALKGIDADLKAITTGGVPALPGQTALNVQSTPDSGTTWTWSLTPTQVATIHTAGGVVQWMRRNNGPLPGTSDGFAGGDIVNGEVLLTATIPALSAPIANNVDGLALDTITLTKTLGITWNVNGVAHKSSDMPGATKVVPYTAGVNTTVTATPEAGYWIDSTSTTSWVLVFTASYANAYTSENFNRTAGALAAGAFTTNAAWGGTPRAGTLTGSHTITADGSLGYAAANSDLIIPWVGVTSASLTFKFTKVPATGQGAFHVNVTRLNNSNSSLGGVFEGGGFRWSIYQVGGAQTDTLTGTVAVGDVFRVDCVQGASVNPTTGALTAAAGQTAVAIYKNGVFAKGATATGVLTWESFRLAYPAGGFSSPAVDDLIVQTPAVVGL